MIKITTSRGTLTIGDKKDGHSVAHHGSMLVIDGETIDIADSPRVEINVTGAVQAIQTTSCTVTVTGDVNTVRTGSGNVADRIIRCVTITLIADACAAIRNAICRHSQSTQTH